MRVTNSMIAGRVTFNAQNSLTRFLNLQTQMSSGKRINKPSDDPLGITRDLTYRNELANNRQYQGNIGEAKSWYSENNTTIENINDIIVATKSESINGADDGYSDASARKAFAGNVHDSIELLLQHGNTKHGGRYIFSGFKTDTEALQRHSNGMTFNGDEGSIKYQIGSNAEMGVNMNGAELFFKQIMTLGEGFDLDPSLNGSTQLSDLHNGAGVDQVPGLIQFTDHNLGITATFDLSAESTIDEVITQINNDLTANGITNVTAKISGDKNALHFEATANGLISGSTPLANLNNGAGVDLTTGLIKVSNSSGIDLNVDLSSATTVDDIITQFNTELNNAGIFNVTMAVNAAGTGLEINDTNGIPLDLSIDNLENNVDLASQLGINGSIDPTLVGNDLNPQVNFEITELGGTTAADLGILTEINGTFVGENLDVQLLTTTLVGDLKNGLGLTSGEIVMWQGGDSATIDTSNPAIVTLQDLLDEFNNSGLDITATINADGKGIQVVNNDRYASFTVEEVAGDYAARDLGIFGSSDMIGTFFVLENSLNSDYDGAQSEVGKLLEHLDLSKDNVLNNRGANGSKGKRLESTLLQLTSQEFMFTSRLSEIEDADLTEVITNLSIYENNYQAALMAAAKIIQPSLLNFLR